MTLRTCWQPLIDVDMYNLPSRQVCNNWRRMVPWLCRVYIGWKLTEEYWKVQEDKTRSTTIMGDGNNYHVKNSII